MCFKNKVYFIVIKSCYYLVFIVIFSFHYYYLLFGSYVFEKSILSHRCDYLRLLYNTHLFIIYLLMKYEIFIVIFYYNALLLPGDTSLMHWACFVAKCLTVA